MLLEIEFNGNIYKNYPKSKHPNYYYGLGAGRGKLILHREIWESVNGKIPDGCVIHHVDENPFNNDIKNLVCVSISEHAKIHYKGSLGNISKDEMASIRKKHGYTSENWKIRRIKGLESAKKRIKKCAECGKKIVPTNVHQKFCSATCTKRSNTRKAKKEYTCEFCKTKFIGPAYYPRNSCSEKCAHKLTALKRKKRSI